MIVPRRLTNFALQGSSARTGRRPSVVLPRSRVPRRRRTNKRIAHARQNGPGTSRRAEEKNDNPPLRCPLFPLSTSATTTGSSLFRWSAGGGVTKKSVENHAIRTQHGFLSRTTLQGTTEGRVDEMFILLFWEQIQGFFPLFRRIWHHEKWLLPTNLSPSGCTNGGRGRWKKRKGAKVSDARVHRACLSYTVCLRPALA